MVKRHDNFVRADTLSGAASVGHVTITEAKHVPPIIVDEAPSCGCGVRHVA